MKKNIYTIFFCAVALTGCSKGTIGPSPVPPEPIDAIFSISASETVKFAPGNLYSVDGEKWYFEDAQYKYNAASDAKHQSLLPYSADFGKKYCQANNLTDGTWKQLTSEQWQYLLEGRVCSLLYTNTIETPVAIEGSNAAGLFIYPDSYCGATVDDTFTWEKINKDGIVFLPATGFDTAQVQQGQNKYGYYWAADALNGAMAYDIKFSANGVVAYNLFGTYALYAVRLVTEVKSSDK